MKETAVDYLFQRLWNTPKDKLTWYKILVDAKVIEKEQIKEAYEIGHLGADSGFRNDDGEMFFKDYYETKEQK